MCLFNKKEVELLKKAGIMFEDKIYTDEDKNTVCRQIADFIMSHSSKNGDISRLQNDYSCILEKCQHNNGKF